MLCIYNNNYFCNMGKEKQTTEDGNPFKGFSIINADVLGELNTDIEEVATDEIETSNLGDDTGIVEKTPEELEQELNTSREVKKKKEEKIEIEDPTNEVDEKESSIKIFADYLGEKGILEIGEDFEDSEEGLEKAIQDKVTKEIDTYKNSLGDISLKFIEYIEDGGDPKNFLQAYSAPDFSSITEEDLENENIQEQLVRELLYQEGYSIEEISEEVSDYKEGGILANKAKRAQSKLIKFDAERKVQLAETQKRQKIKQEEVKKDFYLDLEKDINSRKEIAGFELKDKDKPKFFEYISREDKKTGLTKLMEDVQKDADYQIKMAWLLYNKFDFSKVEKKAEKKVVSSLKENLENSQLARGSKLKSREVSPATDSDFSGFRKVI